MRQRPYNKEQLETIDLILKYLNSCSHSRIESLKENIKPYLAFRQDVEVFQEKYLTDVCTLRCFTSKTSACCSREGIATFFADTVINILVSSDDEIESLVKALLFDKGGPKCVYLSNEKGCLWHLKPIVCEMFLCDQAKEDVLKKDNQLKHRWEALRIKEKEFTWPDKPVLFDELEEIFIKEGLDSPLMYFHKSPGLLRIIRDRITQI